MKQESQGLKRFLPWTHRAAAKNPYPPPQDQHQIDWTPEDGEPLGDEPLELPIVDDPT